MLSFLETAGYIQKKLSDKPLPGIDAMLEMAPVSRRGYLHNFSDSAIVASVLFLVYPKNGKTFFPIIIRPTRNKLDKHRGQLSMPGGKLEKSDASHWACAVRETEEELGIEASGIEYLGELTPLWIPISNFMVYPFVGKYAQEPVFKIQPEEVAGVLELDLHALLDEKSKKNGTISMHSGIELQDVPFFDIEGHKIWGATAMMLNEIVTLLKSESLR
ncbi:MAG TPA: CoA pyrophosphatase [Saprospiraceae bacterium]|nr:coenzyme A pyrophosphatase [Saprospirales bacterium]HRQ29283.1 CoA pyrophosphatase [Saprospiraceae bacterium]